MDFHNEILNKRIMLLPDTDSVNGDRYFYNFIASISDEYMIKRSAEEGFVINTNVAFYRHYDELVTTMDDVACCNTLVLFLNDEEEFKKRMETLRSVFWEYMSRCATVEDVALLIAGTMDIIFVDKYQHGTKGICNVH